MIQKLNKIRGHTKKHANMQTNNVTLSLLELLVGSKGVPIVPNNFSFLVQFIKQEFFYDHMTTKLEKALKKGQTWDFDI